MMRCESWLMSGPIDEGLLTVNRISELEESPVVGRFDTVHLCAIPYRVFQDVPHHHPGQFRRKTSTWVKARALESDAYYSVPYAPSNSTL
jgi:cell filamentation protein